MINNLINILNILLLINNVNSSSLEISLREDLFTNHSKYVRPVKNRNDKINITMGMAVETLEEFNQKEESIMLNIWLRMNWDNEYLFWNINDYNINFLSIDSNEVWIPDIELLNAAKKPEIYTLVGGIMLYSDGNYLWSRPGVFKFSCPLDLKEFPFDIQICNMNFGSWIYSSKYINLDPYEEKEKQIDVLETFSHSEWKFLDAQVEKNLEERDCCPNETFPILNYKFRFQRYPHYYKLSMAMTITLVVVSFIIILMEPDNVSRTSTAVFIPLTILALQLTITNKIPVVGYFTLMDNFFLLCFTTSMLCSIESGIIYSLITSRNKFMYKVLEKLLDLNNLIDKDKKKNITEINKFMLDDKETDKRVKKLNNKINNFNYNLNDDNQTLKRRNTVENYNNQPRNLIEENVKNNTLLYTDTHTELDNVCNNTYNNLKTLKSSNSLSNISSIHSINSITNLKNNISDNSNISTNKSNISNYIDNNHEQNIKIYDTIDDKILKGEIQKVIEYDNKIFNLTYKERLIFNKMYYYIRKIDNIFRIILPIIYFGYIIHIFSYEK